MTGLLEKKSNEYVYSPIAYHDSWLSVDPIVGCRLNCRYCFMKSTHWTNSKPESLYSVKEILDQLFTSRYFIPNKTILGFGNQTDSFLSENLQFTSEFFEALEQMKLENPVVTVTKKRIPADFVEMVTTFKHVKPIFCLSYSGLPPTIEVGVNPRENEENFRLLAKSRFRPIHFWRPLIPLNGSPKILQKVLEFVTRYAAASVYTGLKNSPALYSTYCSNRRLRLPQRLKGCFGDVMPIQIEKRLKLIAHKYFADYPIYTHTSCAVSYVLSIPDYNATQYRSSICGSSTCPHWKRNLCENSRAIPNKKSVESLLSHIGLDNDFSINGQKIELTGEIKQEDYAFLLHNLNYPIRGRVTRSRNLWGSIYRYPEDLLKVADPQKRVTRNG